MRTSARAAKLYGPRAFLAQKRNCTRRRSNARILRAELAGRPTARNPVDMASATRMSSALPSRHSAPDAVSLFPNRWPPNAGNLRQERDVRASVAGPGPSPGFYLVDEWRCCASCLLMSKRALSPKQGRVSHPFFPQAARRDVCRRDGARTILNKFLSANRARPKQRSLVCG